MGGIVDFDVCFPASRISAEDLHTTSGVPVPDILEVTHSKEFPVLGEHELSWELALQAALAVLRRTPVPRGAIRQVIYAGSGEWDVPFWSPAAKVAHELGIDRAHCFEVTNFCNAGSVALRVALDGAGPGPGEYALVLVADRLSRMVDRTDPGSRALFNFGDAAAAMLVTADGPRSFELLHSAMRTDPGWVDYYAGEWRQGRVRIRREPHRPGLSEAYVANFSALLQETLAALGRTPDDIDHFLINQGDRRMHERLLDTIGIPAGRSVFNYDRLGHMGGADTLIALRELADERRLRSGDLVVLATSAMGFSWGITALEYRGIQG
ncbi:3-oxoacyl-[acyl-carrier-protein] synthase III C-terminal domain-containing protein [Streptomyces sp. Go-475]|uniref:3-oxoacyl-ACP synthase III family protein n=1 Tax=Streptomyces sp. Go-475 TaxID=2072505 RepID=UPI000DEF12BB|nr:3-oxoacyl-[acyl-carrier-protein] synthase III C-terminal domain-containing protein [Streptomyces sp. Go-475]AXE88798.1 3-oxoacyl-[acyl-carrier-protein] synthase 3 [Streptomyces sp. Go-475]